MKHSHLAAVLERTLGSGAVDDAALRELEQLLDDRIRSAKGGAISRRSASEIFAKPARK